MLELGVLYPGGRRGSVDHSNVSQCRLTASVSVRRKVDRVSGSVELTLLAIWLPMLSPTSRMVLGHVWLGYSEKVEVVVRNGEFELSACGPNARTIVRLGGAASGGGMV